MRSVKKAFEAVLLLKEASTDFRFEQVAKPTVTGACAGALTILC